MKTLTLTRPDDWHIHLRDADFLTATVRDAARYFGRVIVMPNLVSPVSNIQQAEAYRERVLAHLPTTSQLQPLMTLYLTDDTTAVTVEEAANHPHIFAVKLYPAGATTHSEFGVQSVTNLFPLLDVMEKCDLPLLIHGEVVDEAIDIFDREAVFIDKYLTTIRKTFPQLRIVLEHITSAYAVDYIKSCDKNTAATITAHHLLLNRNDLLANGIHPHHYCLPILKHMSDQAALNQAASSGDKRFFLGSDSAPHAQHKKESACGCAGIYTGHATLEYYAEAFAQYDALDKLEGFASFYGADFYGLPRNQDKITLRKENWELPKHLNFANDKLIPFRAGETLQWKVIDE